MAETIETQEDYSGQGVESIETNEELEAFLAGSGEALDTSGSGDAGTGDDNPGGGNPPQNTGGDDTGEGKGQGEGGTGDGISIGGEGNDDNTGAEFDNILHYIDKRFELKMNLEEIPKDMDAATQAQALGDLFQRIQNGTNAKISEFKDVQDILKDQEVASFIKAKQEGKTLKDYVGDYATTVQGMNDEQVILEELKITMPGSDEDARKTVLEGFRTADKIASTAETMRQARVEREKVATEAETKRIEQQKEADQLAVQADIEKFGSYINRVKDVYGIPMTDQMRQEVFKVATETNEKGETQFDIAVQSDEGMLLASLGLLHLKTLIKANASSGTNKANKSLMDRLISDPSELQSGGGGDSNQGAGEEDEIIAINTM